MQEKIGNVTLDYEYYPGEDLYSDGPVEEELLEIAKNYQEKELNQLSMSETAGRSFIIFHIFARTFWSGFLSQKNKMFWKSGPDVDRSQEFSREKPKVSPVSICQKCAAPSMHIEIANVIM